MLSARLPFVNEPEGEAVPAGLPPVIDAHVHIFPAAVFASIWKWFTEHAWPIRYQLTAAEIVTFLLSRGVTHIVALHYAHKPGIARQLNRFMAEICARHAPRVTGMATVFPGEADAEDVLREAFAAGLAGLKLHAHVQCFDMNSDALYRLYECCRTHGKPVVMHAGREPNSPAYRCDPYRLCRVEKLEPVLRDFPDLRICIPHLGLGEQEAYRGLIEKYDNLWLDTTMTIADYLPQTETITLERYRPDRIMYGSDFPNLPYAWDRELHALAAMDLPRDVLARICALNAVDFFRLETF
jgi:hypothetical protein